VRGGQGDQACSYATSRTAHTQLLGGNAWNDGELRGPQAGGRRQLADEHADATLLVNAAGFSSSRQFLEHDGPFYDSYLELDGDLLHPDRHLRHHRAGPRRVGRNQPGMETVVVSTQHDAAAEIGEHGLLAAQLNDGRHEVNQTCDRCGPAVRAAYRVGRQGELYLCRHCASHHWSALSAQGWTIWPAGEHAVAPQANH
jgi:hypothetical protein